MFFTGVNPGSASSNAETFGGIWSTVNDHREDSSSCERNAALGSIWGNQSYIENPTHAAPETKPLCRYYLQGHCSSGNDCPFSHCFDEHPFEFERYFCEICSEDIQSRAGRFGLLENCDHVFCLNCIREWRNQKEKQDRQNLRKCPICRIDSFLIIPSTRFLQGKDKLEEREKYKSSVAGIPCKNYNNGKGKCQFGTSCMYLHLNEDDSGSSLRLATPINDFTMILGADGKRTKKQSQLSDFVRLS